MQRSTNFSMKEVEVLVTSLESYKELITGELGKSYANINEQKEAWEEIATILNSVALGVKRNGIQVKNKWTNLKCRTRKKAARIRNNYFSTGGGPPAKEKLTAVEEKVLALIGSTCVEGITTINYDICAQSLINERRENLAGNTSENSVVNSVSKQNTSLAFSPHSLNDYQRPQYLQQNMGVSINSGRLSDCGSENVGIIENAETPSGISTCVTAATTPNWHLEKMKNTSSTIRSRRRREKRKRIEIEEAEKEEKEIINTQKNICNILAEMHKLFEKTVENQKIVIENQERIIEHLEKMNKKI